MYVICGLNTILYSTIKAFNNKRLTICLKKRKGPTTLTTTRD